MTLPTALAAALDKAYAAFADAPPPRKLEASPLRDAKAIHQTLTHRPLRDLADADIGPYSSWAITTVGTTRDYQHFLPRILELAVRDPSWVGAEPAIIAEKLRQADWRTWPPIQQAAVEAVFQAAFSSALATQELGLEAEDWLGGLAILLGETRAYREAWRSATSLAAAHGLASFVLSWLAAEEDGRPAPPFWENVSTIERSLTRTWLISDETQAQLARADAAFDADECWMVQKALEALLV